MWLTHLGRYIIQPDPSSRESWVAGTSPALSIRSHPEFCKRSGQSAALPLRQSRSGLRDGAVAAGVAAGARRVRRNFQAVALWRLEWRVDKAALARASLEVVLGDLDV